MGNSREEEEDWFFDAREEISAVSDCNSEVSEDLSCRPDEETNGFDVWTKNPESVHNRRRRFLETMGFSFKRSLSLEEDSGDGGESDIGVDAGDKGTTMLRTSGSDEGFPSDESSVSSLSNFVPETMKGSSEDHVDGVENMDDDQILYVRNESSHSSSMTDRLSESSSSKSDSFGEFQNSPKRSAGTGKRGTKGWLKKLSALTLILDKNGEATLESSDHESARSSLGKRRIVRVQPCKKQFKELSSLYVGQEFSAHKGPILTMKFSLDGQYLATAGEDGVVRIWKITEDERTDRFEIPEADSSYLYFGMNDSLSQIEPLQLENEKNDKNKRWKKSSDSTCVVLPPRVFRISEKPLHEFQGHKGEILDLSWSNRGLLLSSSVDETVRLWQVGLDTCLKVFPHKNYVTCVTFNPVDDNYFISGSIDGKVRIWDVLHCRVFDYTDIRDIVTAVYYRPDGKGAIIGSMTGNCRFYHIIDNQLQLDAEIGLHGKKKVPSKRITGFQFFPGDSNKVMVTSADSQIRILSGVDVICKLKASSLRTMVSPMSASFTSDGKHIVSVTEDSDVHVWNYSLPHKKTTSQKTRTIQSYESFVSDNTSVAIPWCGLQTFPFPLDVDGKTNNYCDFIRELDQKVSHFSASSDCFSLTRGFMVESLMKGSTTWPEEKLQEASQTVSQSVCKSKLKFLRNACQNVFGSPHLCGLVIVAATWDGRIRAYHNYGLPLRL